MAIVTFKDKEGVQTLINYDKITSMYLRKTGLYIIFGEDNIKIESKSCNPDHRQDIHNAIVNAMAYVHNSIGLINCQNN